MSAQSEPEKANLGGTARILPLVPLFVDGRFLFFISRSPKSLTSEYPTIGDVGL